MGRPTRHHFVAEFKREVTIRVEGVLHKPWIDEDGDLHPFWADPQFVSVNRQAVQLDVNDLGITDEELLYEARACVEHRDECADRRPL